jgi:hypothetical protein
MMRGNWRWAGKEIPIVSGGIYRIRGRLFRLDEDGKHFYELGAGETRLVYKDPLVGGATVAFLFNAHTGAMVFLHDDVRFWEYEFVAESEDDLENGEPGLDMDVWGDVFA